MTATTIHSLNQEKILSALPHCLTETPFRFGEKYQGKVRDTYDVGDKLIIITTDRQSAFDRIIAAVPYKGQVLNLMSAFWFEHTAHLVPNHLLAVPDPNVMIVKKCRVFPLEFVMRGYITGSTQTSLWMQYDNGCRNYCGNVLPEGLQKNQPLPMPLLTPTTKEDQHDRPISRADILAEKLLTKSEWDEISHYAQLLFAEGARYAKEHGLILADTKYEFGRDECGNIVLVDEVHTPDSSRFFLQSTYEERFNQGLPPDNFDKEFLRLWFNNHCDPYHDAELPKAPDELIVTLSSRYIELYEMITQHSFQYYRDEFKISQRIMRHLAGWLA